MSMVFDPITADVIAETQRLREEMRQECELKAALLFYADNAWYCKIYGFKDDDPRGFAPVLTDDGKIARAALTKMEA